MKTSTATIACLAAALFLSGSSLMAHGDCRHHDGPSVLGAVAQGVKQVVRAIVHPQPPVRPVYFVQQNPRAEMLRIRELQLQRELAAVRAMEARRQTAHQMMNRRGCTVRPAHFQGNAGRNQAFNDRF